jgi:hypothetical protein
MRGIATAHSDGGASRQRKPPRLLPYDVPYVCQPAMFGNSTDCVTPS